MYSTKKKPIITIQNKSLKKKKRGDQELREKNPKKTKSIKLRGEEREDKNDPV